VAYPLTAIPSTEFATPETAAAGDATALRAASSVTTLDVALTDLLASPHAIAVLQSSPEADQDVVCGDVGGAATADVAVGLRETNGSGDAGLAVLHADGARTTVTVYLVHALVATPATPTGGATLVGVTLDGARIAATQTTFRVGTAYTFVVSNLGTIEEEFVIARQGAGNQPLVAGDRQAELTAIPPGQSKTLTWTFTQPGSYVLASQRTVLAIEVTATPGAPTSPNPLPPPQPVGE
jgi:uncharacterized cupredoxin-like copper-binding protein